MAGVFSGWYTQMSGITPQHIDELMMHFHDSASPKHEEAKNILEALKEDDATVLQMDGIMQQCQDPRSHYFALQILFDLVEKKWNVIPRDRAEAVKGFVSNKVMELAQTKASVQSQKLLLGKLNIILVAIVKQEWIDRWPTFIEELVSASVSNISIAENNLRILQLLSEDIFDDGKSTITCDTLKQLKNKMKEEFRLIYELCERILQESQDLELLLTCLKTLQAFLTWIPNMYIFRTQLIKLLIHKYFPASVFQIPALKCLTEIVNINCNAENESFAFIYAEIIAAVSAMIPQDVDLAMVFSSGGQAERLFLVELVNFLCTMFKKHLSVIETRETEYGLLKGHDILVMISKAPDKEVWKTCLEYWKKLTAALYYESSQSKSVTTSSFPSPQGGLLLGTSLSQSRHHLYEPILSTLREVIIGRMPKPEEVLLREDENGELVRVLMKSTDEIVLYKSMCETLVYLTHLNQDDTLSIMSERLTTISSQEGFRFQELNSLCWAIGAISGAMLEQDEFKFVIQVLKVLLKMSQQRISKDGRAVVASNIMYVVRQYHRFLRAHWSFLRAVLRKLFEFLHELHPGVRDMACETLQRIAVKCGTKVVCSQEGSPPYILEVLQNIPSLIADLEQTHVQSFYETIATMICAAQDPNLRKEWLSMLLSLPNLSWTEVMENAKRDVSTLHNAETCKVLVALIRIHHRVAKATRQDYIHQLDGFFDDMMNVYRAHSDALSAMVASGVQHVNKTVQGRAIITVKAEMLLVLKVFLEKSAADDSVMQFVVAPLLDTILPDYANAHPDVRIANVLSVCGVVINRYRNHIAHQIPSILNAVFTPTLSMITDNFEDYPTIRIAFFELLHTITVHSFSSFFLIPSESFKMIVDAIVWAMKHTLRDIAETGLKMLLEMWKRIESMSESVRQSFYTAFYLPLLQDLFYILTDMLHKSTFKYQASLLCEMFALVDRNLVSAALWDAERSVPANYNNAMYVRDYMGNLLASEFTHISPEIIQAFVAGLFDSCKDLEQFKIHLRDFLIRMKQHSQADTSDLFLEEAERAKEAERNTERDRLNSIPGMESMAERI